ncbi:hypothetical protein OG320_14220 [Microbispora sp. NBC_01189]|uniref:hypothetical protein n=1 Tax=Microbispora sp. NBC_01189 TaxID=2903583 RepID=UPI002E0E9AD4|nr:hypothetical protein OG320_14220 [Microbispora sp. NBC_01189]
MNPGTGPRAGDRPGDQRPDDQRPDDHPTGVAYEQALAARGRTPGQAPANGQAPADGAPADGPAQPYDPLKLCVYATVALLAWLFGAWAVLAFAVLGVAGYWRARRAGLTRSKCYLRDTRLVLAYLGLVALAAAAALVLPHVSR